MTEWWQQPYPVNPDPPAVQQPRWLYPPDVGGGYEPSSDGPDVEAYKIAVCRLGRWPVPKGQFDRDYSSRFAHGEPGEHVPETGIAGIQRQSGLDDSGNLGARTFQILRTALIPDGLPCAGEPALTDTAVELLNGRKWWQYPYEQGPGVKAPFVRPLYAPDWPGEPAADPGPDVVAVKRAVSMLGRWPWQPFDDDYSNQFAHGTSGNVGDTGVAGLQRQQPGLDDTGNLSAKAFEVLRRALVPPCLPHAHEYAFDGYSIQLLEDAAAHQPTGSVREQALKAARSQLGYSESPAGSNQNKYGSWYGMNGVPWCAIFVSWCFETGTAGGSDSFAKGSYYSYVPYVVSDARNRRRGLSETYNPIPGDLVCYDWSWDGTFDHIGIFAGGTATSFHAIEGNTSTSNQSNGGQVMDRSRSSADADLVFVRVAE
jgi:CHAP domain